jgi:hypothetical protein
LFCHPGRNRPTLIEILIVDKYADGTVLVVFGMV